MQKMTLETEITPNDWQLVGAVQMRDVAVDAFPPETRVTCLSSGNSRSRFLLVDCTQQVYRFDTQTRTLERLDKTFFRGYNCYSAKFLRRDTLYSFGGYGFWHTNNILTYYNVANQEWESLNQAENVPRAIYHGFNGYLMANDTFFSALSLYQSDSENSGAFTWDDSVYSYSFKQKTWHYLGQLTPVFKQKIPSKLAQAANWFQVNRYFILKYYENPYTFFLIVDPIRNEARIWKDTHKILANITDTYDNSLQRNYAWGNNLYFRRDVNGATGSAIRPITFSVEDLWKNSTEIGAFYDPTHPPTARWLYGLLAGVVALGLSMARYFRVSKKSKVSIISELPSSLYSTYPDSLTDQEHEVFKALLLTGDTGGLNTEQLNDILMIADKSPDNQRKIRADIIKGLNLKLKLQWGIEEAVERVPTTLDRRMFTYAFKSDVQNRIGTKEIDHNKN